jgi:HEAT repeat protein
LTRIALVAALVACTALPAVAGTPKGGAPTPAPGGNVRGATLSAGTPMAPVFEKLGGEMGFFPSIEYPSGMDESAPVFQAVIDGGKPAIVALVGMLIEPSKVEPNKMEDYKVRWLLHNVATLAGKQEKDRQMVADALLSTLKGGMPKMIQAAVIEELQWVGTKAASPQLAEYLQDDILYAYAAQAIQAFGDAETLAAALPAAKGGKPKMQLIQALGILRDAKSAPAIVKIAAGDTDRDTRIAAMDALGNIGDKAAMDMLLKAALVDGEAWEQTRARHNSLLLAQRLLEAGDKTSAAAIYKTLWTSPAMASERHVRIAALEGLAASTGDMTEVLSAMKADDFQIRSAALQAAAAAPGAAATKVILDALGNAKTPFERASLVMMLGNRHDPTALPVLLKMFKDPDEAVKMSAGNAMAVLGGPEATTTLIDQVNSSQGRDRDIAADALKRIPGKDVNGAVAAAMTKATDAGVRVTLLGVIASRRAVEQAPVVAEAATDKDATVRVAAIRALGGVCGPNQLPMLIAKVAKSTDGPEIEAARDSLVTASSRGMGDQVADLAVPAASGAAAPNALAMMQVFAATASPKALPVLVAETKSTDATIKEAAIRTLAEKWKSPAAAAPLMGVAQAADVPNQRIIALQASLRLISAAPEKSMTADEKMKLIATATKLADRVEEKRLILGALGSVSSGAAIEAAATFLDDPPLKEEASQSVVRIAESIFKANPAAVKAPLEKVMQVSGNNGLKDRARRMLNESKPK